jgi:hypothetical protein
MNDVPIPAGLCQRLLEGISAANIDGSVSDSIATPVKRQAKWLRKIVVMTIVGIICLAAWLAPNLFRRPLLSPNEVANMLLLPLDSLPEAQESGQFLPRRWAALKNRVITNDGKAMVLSEFGLSAIVFPLNARTKYGGSLAGALYVVPKSRWTSNANLTISNSTISYAPSHVWFAWTEMNVVYILALTDQTELEKFRALLGANDLYL